MRAGRALSLFHPTAGRRDVTRTVCDGRSSRESLAGARTKGIGARLGLDQGARLGFISAKLSYALAGRTRIAKLRTRGITTGSRAMLRLTLPDRLARKLRLGQRVM